MVISEVIAELQRLGAIYGDKPVLWVDEATGARAAFTIWPAIGSRQQGTVITLVTEAIPAQTREGVWPTRTG
jgi:hypothetical protein